MLWTWDPAHQAEPKRSQPGGVVLSLLPVVIPAVAPWEGEAPRHSADRRWLRLAVGRASQAAGRGLPRRRAGQPFDGSMVIVREGPGSETPGEAGAGRRDGRRNRLLTPVVRAVLSWLTGVRFDASDRAHGQVVDKLPLVAFRPAAGTAARDGCSGRRGCWPQRWSQWGAPLPR